MLSLDSTTLAQYAAASTYDARAQAIMSALPDVVEVKVYNAGALVGSGTMSTPWATIAGPVITVGSIASFIVQTTGTPNPSTWYLRFESGTKWLRGTFGLTGSGADFTWSRPIWKAGQRGKIGAVTIYTPRFDVRFASFSLTEGADTAALAATAPVANEWDTIPNQSLTIGAPFTLVLADYDPPNTGLYGVNAGGDALPDGLSLDTSTGVISGTPTTAQTKNVAFDATASAEADWIARSTGTGVVWAHDFRNEAEYTNFLRGQSDPFCATLGATPFGNSQAIQGLGVGTVLTENVPAASARYESQTWSVNSAASFPDPSTVGAYNVCVGTPDGRYSPQVLEIVRVTAVNYGNNQITVQRGQEGSGSNYWTSNYVAGTDTVGVGHRGQWRKPFGAFPAGQNGLATADRGIVTGLVPQRDWTGYGDSANNWAFRTAYYGHESYHSGSVFDGDEFWLQFRAKINLARFQNGPSSKFWYLQVVDGSVDQQFFGHIRQRGAYDINRWPEPVSWPYSSGGSHVIVAHEWGPAITNSSYQENGLYGTTCIPAGGYCWLYPPDTWVTWLMHVIPGRSGVAETTYELFAAVQGETEYTTIMSVPDVEVNYDSGFGGVAGFNSFWPQNYANDYAGSGAGAPAQTNTLVEYTQIILSQSWIAPPTV
jgi:hypothetical protein